MMTLFDQGDLGAPRDDFKHEGRKTRISGEMIVKRGKRRESAARMIGQLEDGATYLLMVPGSFSCHDSLEHIARELGPCELWVATWAISNEALDCLERLRREGVLTALHAAVDVRAASSKHQPIPRMHAVCDSFKLFRDCHAKLYVLRSETRGATVSGSMNLTNNPRLENMTVIVDATIADEYIGWIRDVIAKAEAYTRKVDRYTARIMRQWDKAPGGSTNE